MTTLADFHDQRQAALTQRLRAARTAGAVPMWRATDSDAKSARAVVLMPEAEEAACPAPAAEAAAPHATPTSDIPFMTNCSMIVGAVATMILVIYVVKMLMHKQTYG